MSDGSEYIGKDLADVVAKSGWIMPKKTAIEAFSGLTITKENVADTIKLGLRFPHGLIYVCLQDYLNQTETNSLLGDTP